MNYITLNGKRSDEITGLLIQSLPPIVKPLVRTEIEEIDGRDGDIINKLGYGAYDREMTIGLYGKYDIDEVIGYFDSEGIAIFSNEPDKYYKYNIINQIDFERLAKFKQATVTFHVQPFKFSSVDNKIVFNNNYLKIHDYEDTSSGVTVTVKDGILNVKGNNDSGSIDYFYIDCDCYCPSAETYAVRAKATGTGAEYVGIRVCFNAPANPPTLGHTLMYLDSSNVTEQSQLLTGPKTFNKFVVYVQPGQSIDMEAKIWVNNDDYQSQVFLNKGNTVAKPVYKITGNGTIYLSVNNGTTFTINNLDMDEYIIIDTVEMNARYEDELKNRSVQGEFEDLWMNKGENILTWEGNIGQIEADEYSRWI